MKALPLSYVGDGPPYHLHRQRFPTIVAPAEPYEVEDSLKRLYECVRPSPDGKSLAARETGPQGGEDE